MLCYGNPRTLQTYEEHIRKRIEGKLVGFQGDPVDVGRKTVTVSQDDNAVVCHCEFCKKPVNPAAAPSGDASPIIWGYFTKELAKWMKKNYPLLEGPGPAAACAVTNGPCRKRPSSSTGCTLF